jgi:DNA processing protein
MASIENQYLLALLATEGVGPVKARNLIAYCGSAEQVFKTPPGKLQTIPDIGPRIAAALAKGVSLARAEKELVFCERQHIRLLTFSDADFPNYLKQDPSLPLALFVKGTLDFNDRVALAVVGTRKPTEYGRQQAQRFAEHFALVGANVVSGLAYGIDIVAHKATLALGGITTAVLGHGLDRIYPAQHLSVADRIVESGGALVSEFLSGTKPDPKNFPARNRIIAGLSRATLVVEAAESGGALITARMAFDLNREVFAIPGALDQPSFAGCNTLIQQQLAKLTTKPEDILADLDLIATRTQPREDPRKVLSAQEYSIWEKLMPSDGVGLDALAETLRLPIPALVSTLLELEFKGFVRQLPGRMFVRG